MGINLLLDLLPETVTVKGREFFIDTDFRTCIIMERILADESIDNDERVRRIVHMFFPEGAPPDENDAARAIMYHYSCGHVRSSSEGTRKVAKNGDVVLREKQIFDYEHDAPYIYCAFMAQYGIDLNDIEYLHWWKFQALFRGLGSGNKIVEIMGIRSANLSEITSKKERNRIARLQAIYALPDNSTPEEKVARAGAIFGG